MQDWRFCARANLNLEALLLSTNMCCVNGWKTSAFEIVNLIVLIICYCLYNPADIDKIQLTLDILEKV